MPLGIVQGVAAENAVFALVILAEAALGALLVVTMTTPMRVWPPPTRRSWQYRLVWSLTWLALAGLLALGAVDRGTLPLDEGIRFPLGGAAVVGGLFLVGWGVRTLGVHATSGLQDQFVTSGPFRYSRNPQYVGEVIWLLGFSILVASSRVLVAAVLGSALFLLVPWVEEPWLRDRYGAAFDHYVAQVPRFVGRPRTQRDY